MGKGKTKGREQIRERDRVQPHLNGQAGRRPWGRAVLRNSGHLKRGGRPARHEALVLNWRFGHRGSRFRAVEMGGYTASVS